MKVAILGSGNWGTTLAVMFTSIGHDVTLWTRNLADASSITINRTNARYLPGVQVPDAVQVTHRLGQALDGCGAIFLALPVQGIRKVLTEVPGVTGRPVVVSLSKGLEEGTLNRVSEVCSQQLQGFSHPQFAVLSGPTIAHEVAAGKPSSAVVASISNETASLVQRGFSTTNFRLYSTHDVVGVELAGAIKNIMAIAAGICDGLSLGMNTKGALLSRGLAEMTRISEAMGGQRKTLFGLAGVGDLVTTSFSQHSRNRAVGEMVGRGLSLSEALAEARMVAEGVWTSRAALQLGERHGIELPITRSVCEVLFEGKSAKLAVNELMSRTLKAED